MRPSLILTLLLFFPLICPAQTQKTSADPHPDRSAHEPIEGPKIFQYHCAACHGSDGRGHGPASLGLKQAPPDLTLIAQRNAGKFPYQRVKALIEGKDPAPLIHGNRDMPIWGPIFHQVESDQDWGEVRLEAITKYLDSIQQK
jgi:mono/diheme cytochrome c family protein